MSSKERTPQQLQSVQRFVLTACGTSWHASLVGEYMIEALARALEEHLDGLSPQDDVTMLALEVGR